MSNCMGASRTQRFDELMAQMRADAAEEHR